jgi:hypothetical protein
LESDVLLRWVTAAYLAYLVVPIALLIGGSFGELWLNTICRRASPVGGVARSRRIRASGARG